MQFNSVGGYPLSSVFSYFCTQSSLIMHKITLL